HIVQGTARMMGFELTGEVHATGGLELELTTDYVRGDNLTSGVPLPWIPPLRVLGEIRYQWERLGPWREAFAETELAADATQTRLDPGDPAPPGYAILRAAAGAALPVAGGRIRTEIGVRNLLDKRYASFMSRYKSYADAPGRSFTFKLATGF